MPALLSPLGTLQALHSLPLGWSPFKVWLAHLNFDSRIPFVGDDTRWLGIALEVPGFRCSCCGRMWGFLVRAHGVPQTLTGALFVRAERARRHGGSIH